LLCIDFAELSSFDFHIMLWINGGVGGNGQSVNGIGLLELLLPLNEALSLKDPAVKLGYFFLR